jgi:hypothetical protein
VRQFGIERHQNYRVEDLKKKTIALQAKQVTTGASFERG